MPDWRRLFDYSLTKLRGRDVSRVEAAERACGEYHEKKSETCRSCGRESETVKWCLVCRMRHCEDCEVEGVRGKS